MRIITLLENDTCDRSLKCAHGLSLYIEMGEKKILFDLGPGNEYIHNAKRLGIDLSEVDYLFISHGHSDHGEGISKFLRINKKATVYIGETAFDKYFKVLKRTYKPIGIKKPVGKKRIVLINKDTKIEPGIKVYTEIKPVELIIKDSLLVKQTKSGAMVEDTFDHEIYLVLNNGEQKVLISGCSHKGIGHIIQSIEQKEIKPFTTVIGGFHFAHYDSANLREVMYIQQFSEMILEKGDIALYTGHCTGDDAYLDLKQHLKGALNRIKTGTEINL